MDKISKEWTEVGEYLYKMTDDSLDVCQEEQPFDTFTTFRNVRYKSMLKIIGLLQDICIEQVFDWWENELEHKKSERKVFELFKR